MSNVQSAGSRNKRRSLSSCTDSLNAVRTPNSSRAYRKHNHPAPVLPRTPSFRLHRIPPSFWFPRVINTTCERSRHSFQEHHGQTTPRPQSASQFFITPALRSPRPLRPTLFRSSSRYRLPVAPFTTSFLRTRRHVAPSINRYPPITLLLTHIPCLDTLNEQATYHLTHDLWTPILEHHRLDWPLFIVLCLAHGCNRYQAPILPRVWSLVLSVQVVVNSSLLNAVVAYHKFIHSHATINPMRQKMVYSP